MERLEDQTKRLIVDGLGLDSTNVFELGVAIRNICGLKIKELLSNARCLARFDAMHSGG